MMNISANGIKLIQSFEGCVLVGYKDPVGVPTIGWGHTGGVVVGQRITQKQADDLLKQDLKRFVDAVNGLGLKLNQNQFDALVSFSFNVGAGNLKTLVKGRTLSQIANAIPLYNRAGGEVLKGLVRRRQAEKDLFLKPIPKPAPPKPFIVSHKVKKGENLTLIAHAYKTSIERILKLNTNIKNPNLIHINQIIKVPDNR
jgi:GH24 family phage-related lysozyme (muramidase)